MIFFNLHIKYRYIVFALITASVVSCEKQDVNFGASTLSDDPNIVIIDTVSVNAYTFQSDSFQTVNTGYFVAGNHYDSSFGNFQSIAYFDFDKPYDSTSTLNGCTSCYFDSLVVVAKFSGGYYGDTTKPFTLNVNQLTELIDNSTTFGYNTTKRKYNAEPIGSFSAIVSPSDQNTIRIKLSDDLGKDLFNKMQRNSDTVTTTDPFLEYIKGFCFTGNQNNAVYFLKPLGDSDFVMLYYHKNGPLPVNYVVKLPLNTDHQFNGFTTDRTGTNLAAFIPLKTQELSSTETNGYVYMDANSGLYIKFNFPSLYSIKELATYTKIVSASIEIYPDKDSYGKQTFYQLPPALNMYIMNEYGVVQDYLYVTGTPNLQDGDLSIDYIYNENTKYTFDVSDFINDVLSSSSYASYCLAIHPPSNASDSTEQRLVLKALNNSSIKLKLNVLAL